jgi:hypothetical protein
LKPLADHPDFDELVRAAAEHHGMIPELVLKDYWVTRALRTVAECAELKGRVLFKGGTSLSKGWGLIDRFSEDIDLLITGDDYGPVPETEKTRKEYLKRVKLCIEETTRLRVPPLKGLHVKEQSHFLARGPYHIKARFPLPGRDTSSGATAMHSVLVEAGYRGGPHPRETRQISSLLASYLETRTEVLAALEGYSVDLTPFTMELLRPDRTCAEKLLALHQKLGKGVAGASEVPVRHFADVAQLWRRSDQVRAAVLSGEITSLVRDAALISNRYFDAGIEIDQLDLRTSPALNPSSEQVRVLTTRYNDPNERALYYRNWIPFEDVVAALEELRDAL